MPIVTSEFAAIDAIRRLLPGPPEHTQVWIGDDAAVLPLGDDLWLLLAADTVVGGVHADLSLTGIEAFGWKSLAASVSDIAAMGGVPGHALVTVAAPDGTDMETLYLGLAAAAQAFACPIVGGDLTRSETLVITVAVTGTCAGAPVRRDGAAAGDVIWVTGPVGGSAAGLRLLRAGATDDPLARVHARPTARLAEGVAARSAGASAMIDVSDGLAADIAHLVRASGVGVCLDDIPVAVGATFDEAVGGGEDFELVFAAPAGAPVEAAFAGLRPPIRIGRFDGPPESMLLAGRSLPPTGWEHRWS